MNSDTTIPSEEWKQYLDLSKKGLAFTDTTDPVGTPGNIGLTGPAGTSGTTGQIYDASVKPAITREEIAFTIDEKLREYMGIVRERLAKLSEYLDKLDVVLEEESQQEIEDKITEITDFIDTL